MSDLKNILYNKNPLLVFSYLSKNVYSENTATTVAKALNLALSSVHTILRNFEAHELLKTRLLGKNVIYEMNRNNPVIKQFRIFENIVEMQSLVFNLKDKVRKIILFGSLSRGEDTIKSDIDIFILSDEEKNIINDLLNSLQFDRVINPIIANTFEAMELEKNDEIFFAEINKGITIYEE